MSAVLTRVRPVGVAGAMVLGTVAVAGSLPWLTGVDPASTVLRARQVERDADPAALESLRATLGLPDNPIMGTLVWISRAVRGDFGVSWVSGAEVARQVPGALAVSVNLAGVAAAISLCAALLAVTPRLIRSGLGTCRSAGTLRGITAALAAIPEFVIAVVLASVFAVRLGWLPATGWREPRDMILPVASIALASLGVLTRVLMTAIDAVAAEEWVRVWRANGARSSRISVAVARRALAVALPQVMLLLGGLVGAAVVVEDTYAIPGLGRMTLNAALAQDIPVVQASIAVVLLFGLGVGALGAAMHTVLMGPLLSTGQGSALVRRPTERKRTRGWWWCFIALTGLVGGGLLRSPEINAAARHLPPSLAHPLGTDHVGRDVWARVGHGALLTMGLAIALTAVCLVIGVAVGVTSRSRTSGLMDVLNAAPAVFVGVIVAAVMGPGLLSASIAICTVGWIPLAAHARALAAEARASGFHQSAVTSGASRWWILRQHLLPCVARPVLDHATVRLPHLALSLTALGFLGLGAAHDSPEWGKLLADSVTHLEKAPWAVAAPVVSLVLLGMCGSVCPDD